MINSYIIFMLLFALFCIKQCELKTIGMKGQMGNIFPTILPVTAGRIQSSHRKMRYHGNVE
jgi:hypothetical protein